ncbi:hypothetical protein ACOSQ4_024219 [Xanthoceras sorbifolium]
MDSGQVISESRCMVNMGKELLHQAAVGEPCCMANMGKELMHQFIVDPPSCVAVSTKEGLHGVNAKGTGNADETLRSMSQVGMDMDLECDANGPVVKGPREPKSIEPIRGRKSKWKRMARGAQLGSEGVTNGVNLGKHVVVSEPDTDGFVVLDMLIYYKRVLRLEEFQELVVVLWRIWFRRNAFLHGSRVGKDEELLQWCQSYLSEFSSAAVKDQCDAQVGNGSLDLVLSNGLSSSLQI